MRPCLCDKIPPKGIEYSPAYCRKCWLYHNDPVYKRFWDGPSLIEMAANYTMSTAKWIAAGCPATQEKVREGRIVQCNKCFRLERETRKCLECGCPVDEKVDRATDGCPLGLWPGEIPKGGCGGCGINPQIIVESPPDSPSQLEGPRSS